MRVLAGKINMASKWVWLGPLIAVLALLVGAVIAVAISWVVMSYGTFPDRIMPGDTYTVAGYTLQVPNLPHKQYGSSEVPSMTRPVPKLSNQTLEDIHRLGVDVHTSLDEADVQHWMTGGTLIGLKLWNSKMVFDDDIDLAVRWQDREYAWSPEFAAMLARHGLETFYLRGASLKWATREGAAVRIRRQGTVVPTCDIFFVQSRDDGTWAKVNSWHGDKVVHEPKETWEAEWLFPLGTIEAQGVHWPVGRQPEQLLRKQYGPDWSKYIQSPPPLTASHRWAFVFSNWMSAWRVGAVSAETDTDKLKNPNRLEALVAEGPIRSA